MKKRNKKKKYILLTIIGIIFIICVFYLLNNNTRLDIIKEVSANIFNINNSNKVNEEVTSAEINNLKKEIEDLKKTNELKSVLSDKVVINASVIKRSTPYWHDFLTINKGKKDGIKKGYAVMNNGGLIGEVIIVNDKSSEVKLITNTDKSYYSAKFNYKDTDYFGIIKKYNVILNELYLENVIGDFNEEEVKEIDVVTSGLSSNMPSGLLIGKIKKIKKDKYNLSSTLTIELSSNINDLNIVSVVGVK